MCDAGEERVRVLRLRQKWRRNPAEVGANYSNTQFKHLGSEAGLDPLGYCGTETFNDAEVNKYQLTRTLLVGAAYNFTRGTGVNDVQYRQSVVGVDYSLSKRTDLYADAISSTRWESTRRADRPSPTSMGWGLRRTPTNS